MKIFIVWSVSWWKFLVLGRSDQIFDQKCYQFLVFIINIRIQQSLKNKARTGYRKNVAAHQVRTIGIVTSELDLKKSWSGLCLASKVSVWPLKSLSTNQSSVCVASDEPVATRGKRGPGAWAVVWVCYYAEYVVNGVTLSWTHWFVKTGRK